MAERACFMGIDGGGSRTVAVIVDDEMRELGRGQAGPANYHNVGLESLRSALWAAADQACRRAGCTFADLAGLGCGLAGAGRPEDRQILQQAVSEVIPVRPLVLTHDTEIALVAGTGRREGVVLTCGTGSMAYGMKSLGGDARAGGWGPVLGDEGSGYWIGLCGLRRAVRSHDRRAPATLLGGRILAALGLSRMEELVSWVREKGCVDEIAALAPVVGQCAQDRDAVAREILDRAGRELAALAWAVLRDLGMTNIACEIVLAGGTLGHEPLVVKALEEELARRVPLARVIRPRHEPALGAALLALMARGET
jgi:N-acetylmuramic acid 6-phosphate etherase